MRAGSRSHIGATWWVLLSCAWRLVEVGLPLVGGEHLGVADHLVVGDQGPHPVGCGVVGYQSFVDLEDQRVRLVVTRRRTLPSLLGPITAP